MCSQMLHTVEVGGELYCPFCGGSVEGSRYLESLEQEISLSAYLYMWYLLPEVTVTNSCHAVERNVEHF